MTQSAENAGPIATVLQSLNRLLTTLLGIIQTRIELLTTEVEEEVHRAGEILLWSFVALLAAGIGLFLAALLVIVIFWDSHRLLAAACVTVLFFLIAAAAIGIVRAKVRSRPRLLQATLSELQKDRERLGDT
jgi:uncharacterized membrane protein YqjE